MARKTTTATARFHTCPLPALEDCVPAGERDLYLWLEAVRARIGATAFQDSMPHNYHYRNALRTAASTEAYQRRMQCEEGRYAQPAAPEPGVRIAVASKLAGRTITREAAPSLRKLAQVMVSFSPESAPAPIPWHRFNRVTEMGINTHLEDTTVEFSRESLAPNGAGEWEGMTVIKESEWGYFAIFWLIFVSEVRLENPEAYSHSASFEPIDTPLPAERLSARMAPFDINEVAVSDSSPTLSNTWLLAYELTHVESGRQWIELGAFSGYGWHWTVTPTGRGFSGQIGFFELQMFSGESFTKALFEDGTYHYRVAVYDFRREPGEVTLHYGQTGNDANLMTTAVSSVTAIGSGYTPGMPAFASVEFSREVRSVGDRKGAFRVISIEPKPGFGARLSVVVRNELHFPACIVARVSPGYFPTGIGGYPMVVVRNLPANSESEMVSVLVPAWMTEPGIEAADVGFGARWGKAAALGRFADGVYEDAGELTDDGNTLLAAEGVRADLLKTLADGSEPTSVAVRRAPGAEYVLDARAMPAISVSDTRCCLVTLVEGERATQWTQQGEPIAWAAWSYVDVRQLEPAELIARYGAEVTASVASGRPWPAGAYPSRVVFESWAGGNSDELTQELLPQLVAVYDAPVFYRNMTFTVLHRPMLVVLPRNTGAVGESLTATYGGILVVADEPPSVDEVTLRFVVRS